MPVFKSYFKVLKKHAGTFLMYICIFAGIFAVMLHSSSKKESSYEAKSTSFAVFDSDQTPLTKAMVTYLSGIHQKESIKNDSKETMQDELYARNVDAILRIPKGFSDDFTKSGKQDLPEVVTIPGTSASMSFETDLSNYLSSVKAYLLAGESTDQAIRKTSLALRQTVSVSLPDGKDASSHNGYYWFFLYLGWILVAMSIAAITPVLRTFESKELRNRIFCSPYKSFRMNRELFLGVLTTGAGLCILFLIFAAILLGKNMTEPGILLAILNMAALMLVALSLAFLISKLTSNDQIISMLSNIISLGMAFLCGIFVPFEILGNTVIKIAHLLPVYWYASALNTLDKNASGNIGYMLTCVGVQLLFAVGFFVVGVVLEHKKMAMN